jgi:hypothetical protein
MTLLVALLPPAVAALLFFDALRIRPRRMLSQPLGDRTGAFRRLRLVAGGGRSSR